MNVAVNVESFVQGEGGAINIAFSCQTSTFIYVVGQTPMVFASSSTQMRTAILDAAKALLVAEGVAGASTATYRLFGGPA